MDFNGLGENTDYNKKRIHIFLESKELVLSARLVMRISPHKQDFLS